MTDTELATLQKLSNAYALEKLADFYNEIDLALGGKRSRMGEHKLRLALGRIVALCYAQGYHNAMEKKDNAL